MGLSNRTKLILLGVAVLLLVIAGTAAVTQSWKNSREQAEQEEREQEEKEERLAQEQARLEQMGEEGMCRA